MPFLIPATTPQPSDGSNAEDAVNELVQLTAWDWFTGIGIILVSVGMGFALRAVVVRALRDRTGTLVTKLIGRFVAGAVVAFGCVYALIQIGVSIGPLLGLLGLLGLALALAFQDVLSNFIAGTMLSIQRPFKAGDQIGTSDFSGTVEDVSLRSVTLRTFDGVRVFVPNAMVWQEPIVNYTAFDSRRTEIVVGVDYDTDLDAAQQVLIESVNSCPGIAHEPPAEALIQEFADSSINFVVRFWHRPNIAEEWRVRDDVARGIKRDLDAADIEISFPQLVMRFNDTHPWMATPPADVDR